MSLSYAREKIFNARHILEERTLQMYLSEFREFFDEAEVIYGKLHYRENFFYALDNIQDKIKCKNIPGNSGLNEEELIEKIGNEYFIFAEYITYVVEHLTSCLREDGCESVEY